MINDDEVNAGPTFNGDVIFGGGLWRRPTTPAGLITPLTKVRDRVLTPFRFRLENESGAGHLISLDNSDETRPIGIGWDSVIEPYLTWTDQWGSISRCMEIVEQEDGIGRYCAFAQLGAVTVSDDLFQNVVRRAFVRDFKIGHDERHHLLTIETYFLSVYAAKRWGRGCEVLKDEDPGVGWVSCPDREMWEQSIWNMVTSFLD